MPIEILTSDIYGWQVSLRKDLSSTATVELNNIERRYDVEAMIGQVISIKASQNGTTYTEWFKGVIAGFDPEYPVGHKYNIAIQCVSFFHRLERKPVNTERYGDSEPWRSTGGINGEELLNELLGTYGCYDASLYDFSSASQTIFSKIAISENSLADAVRKIAMAAQQELFVNKNGQLVTAPYATQLTTSLNISDGYIKKVVIARSSDELFTRVRVRARYLDFNEKYGTNLIYAGPVSFVYNPNVGNTQQQTQINIGTIAGFELQNALIVANDPEVLGIIIEAVSGTTAYLKFSVAGSLAMNGSHSFNITISASGITNNEATSLGNSMPNIFKGRAATVVKTQTNFLLTPRTGNNPIYRSIKPVDEKEENRIEASREDITNAAKFGVLWDEIDNPYIPNYLLAVAVADRRFEEAKNAQYQYIVDLKYNNILDINNTYHFNIPESNPVEEVRGVCVELNIGYNENNPSLDMSAVFDRIVPSLVNPISIWEEDDIKELIEDDLIEIPWG